MKSKKKIILIIGFILFDLLLIGSLFFLYQIANENKLRVEVLELSKLDIMKDRYNRSYRTIGAYRKVERAIKDYLDDYAVHIQELSKLVDDNQLKTVLSIENIEKENSFEESISYLDESLKQYNTKIEYLLGRLNEDTIKNSINDYTKSPYYRNLYIELMLDDSIKNDFFGTKELLMTIKTKMNQKLNSMKDALIYLKDHRDAWFIEDGEIKFRDQGEYNYYNELLSKINPS